MKDKEKKFEYSSKWNGPVVDRSCTDLTFLTVFGVFMTCWLGVGCYAVIRGDLATLFNIRYNDDQENEILHTVVSTRRTALGLIVGSAVFSLVYIFLLKWLAFQLVLLSVVSWCLLSCFLSYYHYKRYKDERNSGFLTLSVIFATLVGLTILLVICLLKKIRLACRFIEETSEAVTSMVSTLFFPLLLWLLHLIAIVYAVVIGLYLYTIEDDANEINIFLFIIHILGYFWLHCFITALGEMILGGTFASWYWTFRKSEVPFFAMASSAWRTIRYHLGTVAFGSVLITICSLTQYSLRIILHRKTANLMWRLLTRCLASCFLNLIENIEEFVKFMNRNAYIVCALYGKGLCTSASDAMSLVLRNTPQVLVLNNVVTWVLWLGKVSISALMGLIAWVHYTSANYGIENWWLPVIIVVVGSYLATTAFFSVYEVAVDTIYLCFLEDCERNDGSPCRPYYMSRQLRILLHNDEEPHSQYVQTLPIYS